MSIDWTKRTTEKWCVAKENGQWCTCGHHRDKHISNFNALGTCKGSLDYCCCVGFTSSRSALLGKR